MIQRYDMDVCRDPFPYEAAEGEYVLYADHIAALQSIRSTLNEDCADRNCRGTMLEEAGKLRCIQCRTWKTEGNAC